MRLRNNIFAAALDYLKREKGIKTQKKLAELMGVSEDTITRILKDRTDVTEDIITKLQTASGCIFNLQWLRGEDPYNMLAGDEQQDKDDTLQPSISLYDKLIATLEKQVTDKDSQIEDLRQQVADLRQQVALMTKKEPSELPVEYSVKM